MSTGNDGSLPKSMRHKRILDAAADNPNASVEELASHIPTATVELVERVLDEHGDPAATDESVDTASGPGEEKPSVGGTSDNPTETSSESHRDESAQTTAAEPDDPDSPDGSSNTDLTAKQRTVLEYVAMDPSATQREIADRLGIAAATVSNRANAIDGFEWSDRRSFVENVFAEGISTENDEETAQGGLSAEQSRDRAEEGAESDPESTAATESTSAGESSSRPAHQPHPDDAAPDDNPEQHVTESDTDQRQFDDESVATAEQLQALESRVNDLEQHIHDEAEQTSVDCSTDDSRSALDDPGLLHKTVQLWLEDDRFSEAEEAALLQALFS